jgi:PilZ domain
MMLSAELFEQISDALKSDGRPSKDKRLEPRVGMTGEVMLLNVSNRRQRGMNTVRVRDISRTGVGLYHSKRFAKGQQFIIQLDTVKNEPIWMICMTAYCRRLEVDRFSIGARIQQVLNSVEVEKVNRQLNGITGDLNVANIVDIGRISAAILS